MVLSYCNYRYQNLNVHSDGWCTLCVLFCAVRKAAVWSKVITNGDRKNGLLYRIGFNLSGTTDIGTTYYFRFWIMSNTEFQINNYTNGNQFGPSVTSLIDGGSVVTWDTK